MAVCKGCGRPIRFIQTFAGKSIPCDPDEVMYWPKAGARGKVVTRNGEVVSCIFDFDGDPAKATGLGYVPHWATCPKANQFRREKRDEKPPEEQMQMQLP